MNIKKFLLLITIIFCTTWVYSIENTENIGSYIAPIVTSNENSSKINERIICNFNNSNLTQRCFVSSNMNTNYSCSGVNSCKIDIFTNINEILTLESSCEGQFNSTVNGVNKTFNFNCNTNNICDGNCMEEDVTINCEIKSAYLEKVTNKNYYKLKVILNNYEAISKESSFNVSGLESWNNLILKVNSTNEKEINLISNQTIGPNAVSYINSRISNIKVISNKGKVCEKSCSGVNCTNNIIKVYKLGGNHVELINPFGKSIENVSVIVKNASLNGKNCQYLNFQLSSGFSNIFLKNCNITQGKEYNVIIKSSFGNFSHLVTAYKSSVSLNDRVCIDYDSKTDYLSGLRTNYSDLYTNSYVNGRDQNDPSIINNYYDFCSGDNLVEYECSLKYQVFIALPTAYKCENGCINGACVKSQYEILTLNFKEKNTSNGYKQEYVLSDIYYILSKLNVYSISEIFPLLNTKTSNYKLIETDPFIRGNLIDLNQTVLNQYKADLETEKKVLIPFTNYEYLIIKKVQSPMPDLVFENLSIQGDLIIGKPILIMFRVVNKGNKQAYPVNYLYDKNDGVTQVASINTCYQSIKLNPNESCISAVYFNFSTSGYKILVVRVDPSNWINESKETNNIQFIGLNILTESPCKDLDNDGFFKYASGCTLSQYDCNDNNNRINPNAQEVCNNIDDNCDYYIDKINYYQELMIRNGSVITTCKNGTWVDKVYNLPISFDWRNYGNKSENFVTSVKDQGGCGSCWAFAATAQAESKYKQEINSSYDVDFSEQQVLSCSNTGTCSGGWTDGALNYIINNGITNERNFPYTQRDILCVYNRSSFDYKLKTVTNHYRLINEEIKQKLIDKGPLSVYMKMGGCYPRGDGIYYLNSNTIDHAVLLVGYNDTGNYWIIKNSWGTGFGEKGYFKVAYGNCSIGSYVFEVN